MSWLPTLPACRARHTAAQVGWLVARWTWLAAAAVHMGDKARTANIAVLHEGSGIYRVSLMRTRAGRTRDQFHHDISQLEVQWKHLGTLHCFKCFIVVWFSSSLAWTHVNRMSISGGRRCNSYAIGKSWLLTNLQVTILTHHSGLLIAKHVLEAALLTRNASFPMAVLLGCLADLELRVEIHHTAHSTLFYSLQKSWNGAD